MTGAVLRREGCKAHRGYYSRSTTYQILWFAGSAKLRQALRGRERTTDRRGGFLPRSRCPLPPLGAVIPQRALRTPETRPRVGERSPSTLGVTIPHLAGRNTRLSQDNHNMWW